MMPRRRSDREEVALHILCRIITPRSLQQDNPQQLSWTMRRAFALADLFLAISEETTFKTGKDSTS